MSTATRGYGNALTVTSDTGLLDTLTQLTHMIASETAARREAHRRGWVEDEERHGKAVNSLRAQRALVRIEILRRMGSTR